MKTEVNVSQHVRLCLRTVVFVFFCLSGWLGFGMFGSNMGEIASPEFHFWKSMFCGLPQGQHFILKMEFWTCKLTHVGTKHAKPIQTKKAKTTILRHNLTCCETFTSIFMDQADLPEPKETR